MESVGYIIQDKQGNAIFGFGATVDDAWAMVVDGCAPWIGIDGEERDHDEVFARDFTVYGATSTLLQHVREYGGATSWRIVGGVACTVEEAG